MSLILLYIDPGTGARLNRAWEERDDTVDWFVARRKYILLKKVRDACWQQELISRPCILIRVNGPNNNALHESQVVLIFAFLLLSL